MYQGPKGGESLLHPENVRSVDTRGRQSASPLVPKLGVEKHRGLKMLLVQCEVREGLTVQGKTVWEMIK